MQLSLRLSAIAEMVTEGNRLVDVGCDHGYLPVYLIFEKKIPQAIAADVGKGPLSRAREHIHQYGLDNYIETRLSDGLKEIGKEEGDTLVIAGMGGPSDGKNPDREGRKPKGLPGADPSAPVRHSSCKEISF